MTMADINRQALLLPEPTLRRLPWYLAHIKTLKSRNEAFISTTRLADAVAVDPSQIAKDLSFLGIKGKTRIGYEVDVLEATLRDFLGFSRTHNAIIAGTGSLGAALIADRGLQHYGLNIVAGIDIDPSLKGTSICNVPVFDPAALPELVGKLDASIGILAVPVEAAQATALAMIEAGLPALWNFTPTRIRIPENVSAVVTNTSIYSHLAVMYNRLASLENESNSDK